MPVSLLKLALKVVKLPPMLPISLGIVPDTLLLQ